MTGGLIQRIGKLFNKEMVKIDRKREKLGKTKMTMREKTNMMTKHNSWEVLCEDIVNLDFSKEERRGIR